MGWLKSLALSIVPAVMVALPTIAAETVVFPVGKMDLEVSLDTLEHYAETGLLPDNQPLETYLNWLTPSERRQVQELLRTRYSFDTEAASRLLKSSMVASFLEYLGGLIQTESRENGSEAIYNAIIAATATDPEGFNLIEILRQFPTEKIHIDLEEALDTMVRVVTLIRQTNTLITSLEELASAEVTASSPVDFNQMPDLRQRGTLEVSKQTLSLFDWQRNRQFEADFYLPNAVKEKAATQQSTPVIVISHGLASDRSRFEDLARHLASYGFAVAVPQHPGSDYETLQKLLAGEATDIFEVNQFIDRPRDISYLLNHLERLNKKQLNNQLNLEKVGVWGHSFGGYTALALAGATIDFEKLQANCTPENKIVNPSMFLQCRALELPQAEYQFRDPRVKAVVVLNPVNSGLLGELGLSKISIPVMMGASSADLLAPAVLEQIQSFTWLTTSNRYLVIKRGDSHFFDVNKSNMSEIPGMGGLLSPGVEVTRNYMNALSVAFFGAYVTEDLQYKPYLQAAYGQEIGEDPYTLSVLKSLTPTEFSKVVSGNIPRN
ncbi:alpha/beta hydrolase [Limnoraphis robusta Tam1]|uniref:alpha/beta hydrolase n=1 Tax=Limnoraphis robusta TaxID=1118279 RepID=UPI002B20BFD9|nr:alpha/beta hydrolase [Limnoraphis robusta]MEA5501095.1 alpha/beta hydrolase [Limnoraphis robusta BA-68 BA1]MEA5539961.1 alpha/beta hydrolase [Limnoraphis robusta Tam1]